MGNAKKEGNTSRRAVLALGAAAASGGLTAAGTGTAEAADGDPIVLGETSWSSSPTTVSNSGTGHGIRVNCTDTSTNAHAFIGWGKNGYGLIALSDGHNGGKLYTRSADKHGLWAQNTATTSGAGKAIWARHDSAGEGADAATAIRGIQGPGADAFLDNVRSQRWPAAGEFAGANGLIGASNQDGGAGVVGYAESGTGVWAGTSAPGGTALFSDGSATVVGDLAVHGAVSKFGGSFRIDHPLDPENRYLSHSFVESPDMMNIYNGVVEADENGTAAVELPEWFEALNGDCRYQLTPIGAAAPDLHVATEMSANRFSIAGAKPGQRVSWQVTGIRHDAWAEENRIPVDHPKAERERGAYLFPQGFGKPAAAGLSTRLNAKLRPAE